MTLASFDVVYRAYVQIVTHNHCFNNVLKGEYVDFPHQPHRLLEAYSIAWRAIEDKQVSFTSHWGRQQGATTSALALAMTSPDVTTLVSDVRKAKDVTQMIFRAFSKEGGNVHPHVQPNVIHKNVWWVSGINQCVNTRRPKLVVVDSETAWRKDRDQAIDNLFSFLGCGVVVLDAPKPDRWLV